MGGRGSNSFGGGGLSGGLDPADIVTTTSLISERERHPEEVDATLAVLRDVQAEYGVVVEDALVSVLKGKGRSTLGYYDFGGNLALNQNFFDTKRMNQAYDNCGNFHPGRGSKSAIEAVAAHEMGHRLTDVAAVNAGMGAWQLDALSTNIVKEAAKKTGYKGYKKFAAKISGYAKSNCAECVAEAFADVYCNGANARRESRAVIIELKKFF